MKRIISIVLISMLLVGLVGCGSSAKPEDAVVKYFDAAKELDLEAMAATIVPSNQIATEETTALLDDDDSEYTKFFFDYLSDNASKMSYEIVSSEVNDDMATVNVKCSYIDGGVVLKATIGEVFSQLFGLAFSGVEMTEEETDAFFAGVMQEQIELLGETRKEVSINVECVKEDDVWYIAQVNDQMLDVAISGFITAGTELAESFDFEDEGSENEQNLSLEDMLFEIDNFIIGDIWNDGFCDIDHYLYDGTGSYGQELDIDFTIMQLDKAMEKKAEYDIYIDGLDDSYEDIKYVWSKLSPEIDTIYSEIKSGAESINTDLFVQYRDAFSDLVYDF